MEVEGKVIDYFDHTALIEIRRKGACGDNCAHCGGCSAQLMQIEAACPISVEKGDWVLLSSNRRSVFIGLFVVFLMPLLLPLAVYFMSRGSGFEIFSTVAAIILSLFLIWLLNKSSRFRAVSKPKVVNVILKARK